MSWSKYKAVNDYIAAKKRGDTDTTERIVAEVGGRFATRTTDGSEIADLYKATVTSRLGEGD